MNRSNWRLSQCPGSNADAKLLVTREVFTKYHALCPHCGRSCVIRRGRLIEHKPKVTNEPKSKNPRKQSGAIFSRDSKAKNPANDRPHNSKRKANPPEGFVDHTAI